MSNKKMKKKLVYYFGDNRADGNAKMKNLLGRPMIEIEEGVRKTIASGQYNY